MLIDCILATVARSPPTIGIGLPDEGWMTLGDLDMEPEEDRGAAIYSLEFICNFRGSHLHIAIHNSDISHTFKMECLCNPSYMATF